MEEKILCLTCNKEKPSGSFHRDSRSSTGFRSCCKVCRTTINKEQYACNRNKILAKKLVRYAPKWLEDDQLEEIEYFYWLAEDLQKITGEEYHVDHIHPLKGKNFSGLHVPWNLQVLPKNLNLKKGNKLIES